MQTHRAAKSLIAFVQALALMSGSGCENSDKSAIVQGKVTIAGELAPQGVVTFHPVDVGPVAYGPIRPDGSFTMQIGQGKPASLDSSRIQVGDYLVTVVVTFPADAAQTNSMGPPTPGPRLSAKEYSSKDTTDLRCTVRPDLNIFNFDVPRATAEEIRQESHEVEGEDSEPAVEASDETDTQGGDADSAPGHADEELEDSAS